MDWIYIAILYQVLTEFTLKPLFIHTGGGKLVSQRGFPPHPYIHQPLGCRIGAALHPELG